jgi:hypothetical protein
MKKLYIFLVVFLIGYTSYSQDYTLTVNYSVSIPTGDILDIMKSASPQGFDVTYRKFIGDHLMVGGMTGMALFYHQFTGTTNIPKYNLDITGTQNRYFYSVPIMANVGYNFINDQTPGLKPFIGLNIGTYYASQQYDYGVNQFSSNNWSFGVAPELGVMANINSLNLTLSGRYNYGTPQLNKITDSKISLSYFSINFGIGFCSN